MKNKKITRKITQGVYVLTTLNGGCVVDAVSQVSGGENPLIAVAIMKKNKTNELVKESKKFALSILANDVDPEIINTFGLNSMRDVDKFEKTDLKEVKGLNVIKDSLGYILCDVVDSIENDTHTLFIGKMIDGDVFKDEAPMSYSYYQEHKEDYVKVETQNGEVAWVCTVCGYVYYGEALPSDFECPMCRVGPDLFEKKED